MRQAYASVKLPITAVVFTDDTMASPRGVKAMHSHYKGTQVDLQVLRRLVPFALVGGEFFVPERPDDEPRPNQEQEREAALHPGGVHPLHGGSTAAAYAFARAVS